MALRTHPAVPASTPSNERSLMHLKLEHINHTAEQIADELIKFLLSADDQEVALFQRHLLLRGMFHLYTMTRYAVGDHELAMESVQAFIKQRLDRVAEISDELRRKNTEEIGRITGHHQDPEEPTYNGPFIH